MTDFVLSPISLEDFKQLVKNCVQEGLKAHPEQHTLSLEEADNYLTTEEAAQFLKVSLVSIHNWKRDKGLAFYRIGRSIRFKKCDLVAFTEKQKKRRA
jgi:excisionase family DNA binding protein